jgi:type VI secretion system protein VasG
LESGGRMIDAILTQTLLPEISRRLLEAQLEGMTFTRVRISITDSQFAYELT